MTNLTTPFKRFLHQLTGFFPTLLPVGRTQFEAWVDHIVFTYRPAANRESVRFALCAMVLRLEEDGCRKPNRYFAKALHKGAAAQVAAETMREIKDNQAQRAAEVTAKNAVTSSVKV